MTIKLGDLLAIMCILILVVTIAASALFTGQNGIEDAAPGKTLTNNEDIARAVESAAADSMGIIFYIYDSRITKPDKRELHNIAHKHGMEAKLVNISKGANAELITGRAGGADLGLLYEPQVILVKAKENGKISRLCVAGGCAGNRL